MVDLSGYGTKAKKGTAVITKRDGSKIYVKDSKVVAERTKSGKSRVRVQVAPVGIGDPSRKSGIVSRDIRDLKSIATQNKVVNIMGAQQRFQAKVNQALRDVQAGRQQLTPTLRRLLLEQESSRVSPLVRTTPEFAKQTRKSEEIFEQQRVQKELARLVESKTLRPELRKQIGLNADERATLRQLAQLSVKKGSASDFLLQARKKKDKFTDKTEQIKAVADYLEDKLLIKSLTGKYKNVPAVFNEIATQLVVRLPESIVNLGALGVYGADMGGLYLKTVFGNNKVASQLAVNKLRQNLDNTPKALKNIGSNVVKSLNYRTPEGMANILFLLIASGGLKGLGKGVVSGAKLTKTQARTLSKTLSSAKIKSLAKDFRTRAFITKLAIDPKTRRLIFRTPTRAVKVTTKTGTVVVKGFNQRSLALTPKAFTTVQNSFSRVLNKFPTVRKYYTPNLRKAVLLIEDRNGFLLRTVKISSVKGFRARAGRLLTTELNRLNSSLLRLGRNVSNKILQSKINTFFKQFKDKLNKLVDKLKLESSKIKGIVLRGKTKALGELNKLGVGVKNIKTDFVNKFPKTFTVYDKEAGKLAKFIVRKDGEFVRVLNVRTLGGLRRQYGRLLVRELNKLNTGLLRLSKNTKLVLVKNRIISFFNILKNKLNNLFKKIGLGATKIKGSVKRISKTYTTNLKKLGVSAKDLATFKNLRGRLKGRVATIYDKDVGDLVVLLLKKEGQVAKAFNVATAKKLSLNTKKLVSRELGRLTRGVVRVKTSSKALQYLSNGFNGLKNKIISRYDSVLSKAKARKVSKVLKKDFVTVELKKGSYINKIKQLERIESNKIKFNKEFKQFLKQKTKQRIKSIRNLTKEQLKHIKTREKGINKLIELGILKSKKSIQDAVFKFDYTKPAFKTEIIKKIFSVGNKSEVFKRQLARQLKQEAKKSLGKLTKAPRTLTKQQRKLLAQQQRGFNKLVEVGVKNPQYDFARWLKPLVRGKVKPVFSDKVASRIAKEINKIEIAKRQLARDIKLSLKKQVGLSVKAPRKLTKLERKVYQRSKIKPSREPADTFRVIFNNKEVVKGLKVVPKANNIVVKKGSTIYKATKTTGKTFRVQDVIKKPVIKDGSVKINTGQGQVLEMKPLETVKKAVKKSVQQKTKTISAIIPPNFSFNAIFAGFLPNRKNLVYASPIILKELLKYYDLLEKVSQKQTLLNNPTFKMLDKKYLKVFQTGDTRDITGIINKNSSAQSLAKVLGYKPASKVAQKEKTARKVAQKEKVVQRQTRIQKRKQSQAQQYLQRLRTLLRRAKRRVPKKISSILKKPKLSLKDKEELVLWVKSFQKKYRPSLGSVIFGFTGFKLPKSALITPVTTRRIITKR